MLAEGVGSETREERRSPERRCIVTRAVLPRSELLRFVVAPDGELTPDLAERLPGRGIWVTADAGVLARACGRNMFARAAGGAVRVPGDLPERVTALSRRRALDALGQARRAGLVVAGFQQVRDCLRKGEAVAVIEAADAAENGRAKLASLVAELEMIDGLFAAEELGAAIGRPHVVHVALRRGGSTSRFINEAARYRRLLHPRASSETKSPGL